MRILIVDGRLRACGRARTVCALERGQAETDSLCGATPRVELPLVELPCVCPLPKGSPVASCL